MRIQDAKRKLEQRLMLDKNVTSISTELRKGKRVICIGVARRDSKKVLDIPKKFQGFPVEVYHSGGVKLA
ncbi:MAG TPA: hypothetical protein VN844_19530 [Pyrinomonadaceae bacterium]|nr:hypothetical protein [Pyrinomonadaceae bacterium]